MKRNQKGFGAIEVLLLLILVSIIVFIGYYVYHTSNSANSNYDKAASTSTSTAKASTPQLYYFKELGVYIPLTGPPLKGNLEYSVSQSDGQQILALTTPQFVDALNKCNPENPSSDASFAAIDKKPGTYPKKPDVLNGDGALLKQFSDSYVEVSFPNGLGCGDTSKSDSLDTIYQASKTAILAAFKSATQD